MADRELEIFKTVGLDLNLKLISDAYWDIYEERMPEWGLFCYPDL